MTFLNHFNFFWITILIMLSSANLKAQNKIICKLSNSENPQQNLFNKTATESVLAEDTHSYKFCNTDFREFSIRKYIIQPDQYLFNKFLNHVINRDSFNKLINETKIDTTKLSHLNIKCYLSVLFAKNKKGKKIVIIDTDNDKNFDNEKKYDFKYAFSEKKSFLVNNVEVFAYTKIMKRTLRLNLLQSFIKFTHSIDLKDTSTIQFCYDNSMHGIFNTGQKNFDIYVSMPPDRSLEYKYNFTKIYIKPVSQKIAKEEIPSKVLYNVGDTIHLNNAAYLIQNCSLFGDSVTLVKLFDDKYNYGYNENDYLQNDSSFDELTNTKTYLSVNKAKYKILDFWGSWCGPCEEALPVYKQIFMSKKAETKKFAFYSIAIEYNNSIKYVSLKIEQNKMDWNNIAEYPKSIPSVNKNLKVSVYPTFVVLDENNKILFRRSGKDEVIALQKFINTL